MKKYVLIIIAMIFCLQGKAQYKKNSINFSFGSVVSTKMESFSPAFDLSYRRDISKCFGLNAGYKFKNYDLKSIPFDKDNNMLINTIDYKSSTFYLGIDYSFRINNIYITPIIGAGYSRIETRSNDFIGDIVLPAVPYIDFEECNTVTLFSGINLGYEFERFRIFCSYYYDFPQINHNNLIYDYFTDIKCENFKEKSYYYNGDFKLGVAFKF